MKLHKAWFILICATLMIGFTFGIPNMVIAIFLQPIATALNAGMGTISLYFSFRAVAGLVALPLLMPLIKKVGFRRLLFLSAILGSLNLYAMAKVKTGMLFALLGIPLTFLTLGNGMQAMFIMINNWFEKKVGLATAIAGTASAIATFVFSPIFSRHLVNHSWDETMALMAFVYAIGTLLLSFTLRFTPQELGLQPHGHGENQAAKTAASVEMGGITLKESIKTPAFYILSLIMFGIGVMGCINQQLSAMGYSIGMDAMTVSKAAMFNSVGLLIGKPLIGWVRDRFGGFGCTLYGCTLGVLACGAYYLAITTGSYTFFYAGQVLAGFGLMLATILPALLTTATFGRKSYGEIFSIISVVSALGSSLGATLMGNMYDRSQSYLGVVIMCAVILALCIPLTKITIRSGEKLWKN